MVQWERGDPMLRHTLEFLEALLCRDLSVPRTAKVGAQQSPLAANIDADIHMSRRFYIETSASGKKQFVAVKRSRSHSHSHSHSHGHGHHKHHDHQHQHPDDDGHDHKHHKHHQHHDQQQQHQDETCLHTQDYYRVRVDDWNRIKERARRAEEQNKHLVAELDALKASVATELDALKAGLATAQAEAHDLATAVVPQLQSQVTLLTTDNEALRKSLQNASDNEGKHCREEEKLKQTVDRLERELKELKDENAGLRVRAKHLQHKVEQGSDRRLTDLLVEIGYWRDLYRHWKGKYDGVKRLHDDVRITLDIRTDKMRAYEEILKRRGII
ncbi:hypothetical protein E4U41_004861 [Claviceps citrina]|nr:hypothetical protein E4U41_004861 [Claviceps citrina]